MPRDEVRVDPDEFENKASEILDDGTEQGQQDCKRCIMRTCGRPFDISGVPSDMSRSVVQEMLRRRAAWDVEVIHPKIMKKPGMKQWRVLAPPTGPPAPEQIEHRGQLLLVTSPEKKRSRGVVRKPRARKKNGKGGGKGAGPPQPK